MSGVGEAATVVALISNIIPLVSAAKNIYDAAEDASGLPKKFRVPRDDRSHVEQLEEGGLFRDSHRWILSEIMLRE
jgi:hypothetical protein